MKRKENNNIFFNVSIAKISIILLLHSTTINSISTITRIPRTTIARFKTTSYSSSVDSIDSVDNRSEYISSTISDFVDSEITDSFTSDPLQITMTSKSSNTQSFSTNPIDSNSGSDSIDTTDYSTVLPTRWRPRNRFGGASAATKQINISTSLLAFIVILISAILVLF